MAKTPKKIIISKENNAWKAGSGDYQQQTKAPVPDASSTPKNAQAPKQAESAHRSTRMKKPVLRLLRFGFPSRFRPFHGIRRLGAQLRALANKLNPNRLISRQKNMVTGKARRFLRLPRFPLRLRLPRNLRSGKQSGSQDAQLPKADALPQKAAGGKKTLATAIWVVVIMLFVALSGYAGYLLGVGSASAARQTTQIPSILSAATSPTSSPVAPQATLRPDLGIPTFEFYAWPLQASGRITSCFGSRRLLGAYNFHKGLDIAVPMDTPVLASKTGVVENYRISADPIGFGTYVLLSHIDGMYSIYAHLQPRLNLELGQIVRQGEIIAYSGNTGFSTGPHLHFELIDIEGKNTNPAEYLISRLDAPIFSSLDDNCWYRDVMKYQN